MYKYCDRLGNNPDGNSVEILRDETRKPSWVAPGRYISRHMLEALVEEMGREYEHLLRAPQATEIVMTASLNIDEGGRHTYLQ